MERLESKVSGVGLGFEEEWGKMTKKMRKGRKVGVAIVDTSMPSSVLINSLHLDIER